MAEAPASIIVTSWFLDCGLSDITNDGSAGATFRTVQSPFVDQHQASLENSTVSASYNITFDTSSLDFRMTGNLTAQGSPPVFQSGCDGNVQFVTDTALLLSTDTTYTWNLPAGDREVSFAIGAGRPAEPPILNEGGGSQPIFGDPPIGTWTVRRDSILLPGNSTYSFGYNLLLQSFSGNPSVLSIGTASVHFNLQQVPEPSTMLLFASSIPILARRRGQRRQIVS